MKKFDKSKTIADGYRPIYANNAFTMVNLNASIKSMKELHGFCTCNSLPAGRIAKLQGGYYILDDDSRWQLLSGSLENVTFETLFNKLNNLNKQAMRPAQENKQESLEKIDYLESFINQFTEGHELQQLLNSDWTVERFLIWLKFNNFKINKS